ncbi:hypothetical protein QNH14_00580 [Apirhabdus apintestini]|nr:hypothetical protein QNH14_00580 [Enterobacteriaceae bacterium CA-0114]
MPSEYDKKHLKKLLLLGTGADMDEKCLGGWMQFFTKDFSVENPGAGGSAECSSWQRIAGQNI